jgi:hypothetical protein
MFFTFKIIKEKVCLIGTSAQIVRITDKGIKTTILSHFLRRTVCA